MKKLFVLLAAFVAMGSPLTLFSQAGPAVSQRSAGTSAVVLQPGDFVRIGVWQQPTWSGDFQILGNGTIAHPLYREIRVAGIPVSVAEDRMRTFLRRYEATPTFFMQPLFQVSVGGEVREPKLYTLSPEVTIPQAIALAGGATERGQLDRVRLIRGGTETPLNLANPDAQTLAMTIRSGDQIIIPQRSNVFRDYIVPGASIASAVVSMLSALLILGS